MRGCVFVALAFVFFLSEFPAIARANHFEIKFSVTDGQSTQSGKTETEPPEARDVVVRPVFHVAMGSKCTATWKITCHNKETLKDILIHFYVVRIDKLGQAPPPLEPKQVVIETAQAVDLASGNTASGTVQFLPDEPGIYLVRVETQGSAEAKGHEHYAAIDLVVK